MRGDERNLRLRVTRREEPDLAKLIEWVLHIAETRHRAWLNGELDPYGFPIPESLRQITKPGHGPARFAGPSNSTDESET